MIFLSFSAGKKSSPEVPSGAMQGLPDSSSDSLPSLPLKVTSESQESPDSSALHTC